MHRNERSPGCNDFSVVKLTASLERERHWMFWASRGSLAVVDQALIAASNFVMGILLARWLLPEQYGSYAIAFAIFLLLSLFYQAMLLEPQRVFGPSDYAKSQREYFGALLWIHSGVALGIVVALGISAALVHAIAKPGSLPNALVGVTIAAPCVLLLWLARGAFYVRMAPQYAVWGSAAYCVFLFAGLLSLFKFTLLSVFSAFALMALAAMISAAVLLVRLRPVLTPSLSVPKRKEVYQQHWKYGRWMLISFLLSWLTGDIYYPLVSTFSGIASAGELKAVQNLTLPLAQLLNALCVFALPHAARVFQHEGMTALMRMTQKMTVLFGLVAVAYWALLIGLSKPVLQTLYGSRYLNLAAVMPIAALGSLPWGIAYVPTLALRAVKSSSSLLGIYCLSSAIAVALGIPATKALGLRGALWTMVLSNLAALVLAFTLVHRKVRSSPIARA